MKPTSDPDVVIDTQNRFRVVNILGKDDGPSYTTIEQAINSANKYAENLQKETKIRDEYINRRRQIAYKADVDISVPMLTHLNVGNSFGPNGWRKSSNSCSYCGSCKPNVLAEYIRLGATLELADQKYGWPHKWYIGNAPDSNLYGKLATVKFYSEHLKDASADDREVIERAMGVRYAFGVKTPTDVQWTAFKLENKDE